MRETNIIHHRHGPFVPTIDPETFLPDSARVTLQKIRDDIRESTATAREIYKKSDILHEKTSKIRTALDRNARENITLRNYSEDKDPIFLSLQKQLAEAQSEISRLERRLAEIDEAQRPQSALVDRIEKFIARLQAPVASAETPAPKLAKGETIAQAVARLRAELSRLKEDRQATLDAPIPSTIAKKIAKDHVLELSERGRPDVLATLEGRSPPAFSMRERERISIRGTQAAGFTPAQIDTLALFAWLHRDAMIASLHDEIDRVSDDKISLTDAARAARLIEIDRLILSTERSEEAAIRICELENSKISRRADADLRAVLAIETPTPAG